MSNQAELAMARRGLTYNLEEPLGNGAFGVVIAATMPDANHVAEHRGIAVKYCDTTRFANEQDPYEKKERYMQLMHEKWVLATMRHANIVKIYHIFIDMDKEGQDHRLMIYMERMPYCESP